MLPGAEADPPLAKQAKAKATPQSIARTYSPPSPEKLRWRPFRPALTAMEQTAALSPTPAGSKPASEDPKAATADAATTKYAVQTAAAQGPAELEGNDLPNPGRARTLNDDDLPTRSLLQDDSAADMGEPGRNANAAPGDCSEIKADCDAAWQSLRGTSLDEIALDIAVAGAEGTDFPCVCVLHDEEFKPRAWAPLTFTWKASGLCHKPLYFEDVHLERYGHSWNPVAQPFLSAAHFFVNVPLLPYHMGIDPPNECQYSLGYYRPGSCAPYLIDPIPISLRGGLWQAGAIIGAAALIP